MKEAGCPSEATINLNITENGTTRSLLTKKISWTWQSLQSRVNFYLRQYKRKKNKLNGYNKEASRQLLDIGHFNGQTTKFLQQVNKLGMGVTRGEIAID